MIKKGTIVEDMGSAGSTFQIVLHLIDWLMIGVSMRHVCAILWTGFLCGFKGSLNAITGSFCRNQWVEKWERGEHNPAECYSFLIDFEEYIML